MDEKTPTRPDPLPADLAARLESLSRDNESLAAENARLARELAAAAASHASELAALRESAAAELASLRESLEAELAASRAERDRLVEIILLANQRLFAPRSERVVPGQLTLFNDMEASAEPGAAEPEADPAPARPRRRGGPRRLDLSKMEQVVVRHELPEGERACPSCGGPLEEMGVEVSYTVRMVPARLVAERHERVKYRCPACCAANAAGGDAPSAIVRAPMPAAPVPGSFAGPSLIAHVLNGKYANALPLYRMEGEFSSLGAPISRQNMANWSMSVWERWLSPLWGEMRALLLRAAVLHADETEVQVLREPGREARQKSRMWLFCTAPRCGPPIYLYRYDETRSQAVPRSFLGGWRGTLVTDGYPAYFTLGGGVTNVACLVHVRRKFAEIVKAAGGDMLAGAGRSVALEARRRIDAIFAADSAFDGAPDEDRRLGRDARLRPMMESFGTWALARLPEAAPGLALHRALSYAVRYWPYVTNALDDGRCELDNNVAERAIKPFVIGRKNWLFSDTPRGARASAGIYSLVTTARANGLAFRPYAEWLLEAMPNAGDLSAPGALGRFLPWSPEVPGACRLAPEAARRAAEMPDDPIVDVDPDLFPKDVD